MSLEREIWSAQDCAGFLNVAYKTFMNTRRYAPGFPAPLDIPGHPRWSSKAVKAWALGEKVAA